MSEQLINKSIGGKYSKNKFFKQFPQIIQEYFQGSESNLFKNQRKNQIILIIKN
jgi:hypothetical protein